MAATTLLSRAQEGMNAPLVRVEVDVGSGLPTFNIEGLAQTVVRVTGSKSEIVFEALPVDDPQVRQPDITRARQLLGWEPTVPLDEGLRRILETTTRESLSV